MIVYESHRIAAHVRVAGYPLIGQCAPITVSEGIVDDVFQREIEGCRGVASSFDPAHYIVIIAVPILSDGKLRLGILVVYLNKLRTITLHHVVSETLIAHLFLEELQIGLHVLLYVLALVV